MGEIECGYQNKMVPNRTVIWVNDLVTKVNNNKILVFSLLQTSSKPEHGHGWIQQRDGLCELCHVIDGLMTEALDYYLARSQDPCEVYGLTNWQKARVRKRYVQVDDEMCCSTACMTLACVCVCVNERESVTIGLWVKWDFIEGGEHIFF